MADEKSTVWPRDMELAKKAGINTLSVGIFSWATLEPEEGRYTFEWLDEVMDMLAQNGLKAVLATPAARAGLDGGKVSRGAARDRGSPPQPLRRAPQPLPDLARVPRKGAQDEHAARRALQGSPRARHVALSPTNTAESATAPFASSGFANG